MNEPIQKPVEILQYKTNVGYFVKAQSSYSYHICRNMFYNGVADTNYNRINGYIKLDNELTSVQQKIQPTKKDK